MDTSFHFTDPQYRQRLAVVTQAREIDVMHPAAAVAAETLHPENAAAFLRMLMGE